LFIHENPKNRPDVKVLSLLNKYTSTEENQIKATTIQLGQFTYTFTFTVILTLD